MSYQNQQISDIAAVLTARFAELAQKTDILKAVELRALYDQIKTLPPEQRGVFGKEVNQLKQELESLVASHAEQAQALPPIDVTAPFDQNVLPALRPQLLPTVQGSIHPLMQEIERVLDIFYRMGFTATPSPELDDDYHMFGALNFPEGHPARDDYDTFMTEQADKHGKQFIAPAHTSTMQHRVLRQYKAQLEAGEPIAAVIPGRVFRNEDLDARHEHTFYQLEGVYVGRGVTVGNLIATLKAFLKDYYAKDIKVKTQPFYFPFTEPSFEFAAGCPFCDEKGCSICSYTGWIELGGCGMIHPNVLNEAGIDSKKYTGFAWGFGIERMVMIKYGIEDVRHFKAAKLDFLKQFS